MKNNISNPNRKLQSRIATIVVAALIFAFAATPALTNAATYLTSDLQVGSTGAQVSALQLFLAEDPAIYPQALMTGYFGSLTKAAVIRFQARYGIPQVGRVGPQTRAKINSLGALGGGSINSNANAAASMSSVAVVSIGGTTSLAWNTNELTRAKLFYNTVPLVAVEASANFMEPVISGQVLSDATFALSHTFSVNTASNTLYYFRAMSIDQTSNVTVSTEGSFRSM